MIPSCDQTGVPGLVGFTHFSSSTTSGSASLMSVRILPRVTPRQSRSPAILAEISFDADGSLLFDDLFMVSPFILPSRIQPTAERFQPYPSARRRHKAWNRSPPCAGSPPRV